MKEIFGKCPGDSSSGDVLPANITKLSCLSRAKPLCGTHSDTQYVIYQVSQGKETIIGIVECIYENIKWKKALTRTANDYCRAKKKPAGKACGLEA
ncbi:MULTISPECIES: hypothetical protein [Cupriavidus]|uniref:hypothetical protein n=1 Tax=Cupriavidus TaxID=106589 RepID=UPI00140FB61F|nr:MULTISPECIES: hypothetical protein [Cupriavidus]QYY28608.1 hypothetical protein K2O51_12165 [Cupriavidus pinatubonensis]